MKTTIYLPKTLIKSNEPVAILSQTEYESLIETLEILSNQPLLKRIESALNNIRNGRFFSHSEVFSRKRK
ncbi:MAG: hypothetical protein HZA48_00070 [Planctomycetes bacterium]|nr:hypothetical protein [Planctomycetota bacterium]